MASEIKGLLLSEDPKTRVNEIADLFASMKSDEQAQFFNQVYVRTTDWVADHAFQWAYMREHMSDGAKEIIKTMWEHVE